MAVRKRDSQTTWAVLVVCFFYFVCVTPRIICYIFAIIRGDTFVNHYVSIGLYCIYVMHYALNFVIYAARSEQYRQAYTYFINEVGMYVNTVVCYCNFKTITYLATYTSM